jgi:serine/threonine protein kinase
MTILNKKKFTTDDFSFIRLIGKGGQGNVYICEYLKTKKICTIKIIEKKA